MQRSIHAPMVLPALLASLLLAAMALVLGPAQAARAGHVAPTPVAGNPTCGDLIPGSIEVLRISGAPTNGPYSGLFGFSVTIQNATSTSFDFTGATLPVAGVFVKGGPQGNFYSYNPAVTADTGLNAGLNPNSGQLYGISHVSFCVLPVLSISKTAATSFDRDWTWTIEKTANPTSAGPLEPGDSVSVTYTVVVTKSGPTDSNFAVTGTITINNPWPIAATGVSVTDVLSDGTSATVNCPATTVPAGGSLVCTYSASPTGATANLNTATVTTTSGPAGGTATATVTWGAPANEENECATVDDDLYGPLFGGLEICGSQTTTYTQTVTVPSGFECPGTYTVTNVATVTPNDGGDTDSDDATVVIDVVCAPPGGEGCTPGFWRQTQHLGHWTTYSPGDLYDTVFGVDATGNLTLYQAVWAGGGGENALLRHSVAALLNAASADVDYAYTVDEVIDIVQAAYASGDYGTAAALLAAANEAGCPL